MEERYKTRDKQESARQRALPRTIPRGAFRLPPDVTEEIKRRDDIEHQARHPELFPEYNIPIGSVV